MRASGWQGLASVALVAIGCAVAAGWAVALIAAGSLLFVDYSLDRWGSR